MSKFYIYIALIIGFSPSLLFANEAPVVDAQQDSASTQVESVGAGWQSMPNTAQNNAEQNPQSAAQNDGQLSVQDETPVATTAQNQNQNQNQNSSNNNSESENTVVPNAAYVAPTGSIDQRVARLEQQIANITQMNLPQQVDNVRQSVAQLQGQMQVEDRDIKTLTSQQTSFYQDLQQQIAQLKKPGTAIAATATTTATAGTTATATPADSAAYDKAFKLISARNFPQAKIAFNNYLQQFPKGRFVANTHFWLGEIGMNSKDYSEATTQFQDLISQYPTSSKVPDAKLKIATIHAATGKTEVARKEFAAIQKTYPGTTAAQLASIRLQQLG